MYICPNDTCQQILINYNQFKSIIKIKKDTGFSYYYIKKILSQNGINHLPYQHAKTFSCNENYFNQINTKDKAYWLGFIAADGCISRRRALLISLSECDQEILEKLKQSLHSNHPIKSYITTTKNKFTGKYVRFSITSKQLTDDLIKLGLTPAKSLTLQPPNISPDLYIDFLRGFFDGDGGISFHNIKARNGTLQAAISITSTKEMCNFFARILEKYNFNINWDKRLKGNSNNYSIRINGNYNVLRFCRLIYKDAQIFMQRKYDRYSILEKDYNSKHKGFLIYSKPTKNKKDIVWSYSFIFNKIKYSKYYFKSEFDAIKECLLKLKEVGATKQLLKFNEIYNLSEKLVLTAELESAT